MINVFVALLRLNSVSRGFKWYRSSTIIIIIIIYCSLCLLQTFVERSWFQDKVPLVADLAEVVHRPVGQRSELGAARGQPPSRAAHAGRVPRNRSSSFQEPKRTFWWYVCRSVHTVYHLIKIINVISCCSNIVLLVQYWSVYH